MRAKNFAINGGMQPQFGGKQSQFFSEFAGLGRAAALSTGNRIGVVSKFHFFAW